MTITDPGKMILLALIIVCGTILAVLDVAVGEPMILLTVGYLVGNGRLAARGDRPTPVIGVADPHTRSDDDGPADPHD